MELLVVIAIIALLVAVLMPALEAGAAAGAGGGVQVQPAPVGTDIRPVHARQRRLLLQRPSVRLVVRHGWGRMVAGVYVAVVEGREDVAVPDRHEVPLYLARQRRPKTRRDTLGRLAGRRSHRRRRGQLLPERLDVQYSGRIDVTLGARTGYPSG